MKSNANQRVHDLEFILSERVLLNAPPIKGAMRFGMTGKINLRFIGPFEVLQFIGGGVI